MITMIPRHRLEAHPDNPRKELGDLSELAASIRKQGLLQNLTVVPHPEKPDKYRIVIGHRRFSASGIAGLEELPCTIDEHMSYAEQLAVMMSENMQRNDLTVAERVGGVQMMMDLGMSALEVADSTGISESSVRRYAKLANLDKKGMRKAEERGVTLMQFADICAIEDENMREEALKKAGTAEYNAVMHRARLEAACKHTLPIVREKLQGVAVRADSLGSTRHYCEGSYWLDQKDTPERLDKWIATKRSAKKRYVYVETGASVTLYSIVDEKAENDAAEQRRIERERVAARVRAEGEVARGFAQMRREWMKGVTSFRRKETEAMRFVLWAISRTEYLDPLDKNGVFDYGYVIEAQRETTSTGTLLIDTDFIENINDNEVTAAVVYAAFDRISRGDMSMMDRYTGKAKEKPLAAQLYRMLEPLGYPVSAEERAWLNGEHECFSDAE